MASWSVYSGKNN